MYLDKFHNFVIMNNSAMDLFLFVCLFVCLFFVDENIQIIWVKT